LSAAVGAVVDVVEAHPANTISERAQSALCAKRREEGVCKRSFLVDIFD
jgi:hypothetical protein